MDGKKLDNTNLKDTKSEFEIFFWNKSELETDSDSKRENKIFKNK